MKFDAFRQLASSSLIIHIAPGNVLKIGGLMITNSMLYGWLSSIVIIVLMIWVARRITIKPKAGFTQIVEIGVEFIGNTVEGAFDDKKVGRKYVPYFVTLFFFILFCNWLGLLPIVGDGFHVGNWPLLRPFTGDLDGTFAMGVATMLFVYGASIHELGGLGKYLRHFFIGNPKNPLYFSIGLMEIVSDLTRVLSLSLRLFLNITIGEIVIAVFAYLGQVAAPLTALPFTILEFLVAALQAYIFTILGIMYLAITVNQAAQHNQTENLTSPKVVETMDIVNSPEVTI